MTKDDHIECLLRAFVKIACNQQHSFYSKLVRIERQGVVFTTQTRTVCLRRCPAGLVLRILLDCRVMRRQEVFVEHLIDMRIYFWIVDIDGFEYV